MTNQTLNPRPRFTVLGLCCVTLLLGACGKSSTSGTPPSVALSSPAVGATLNGTVAVQINAQDDDAVAKVSLYARASGSTVTGLFLGSAVTQPYVISVDSGLLPNHTSLELYAVASDRDGQETTSDPVRVQPLNPSAPELRYLVAYTMPPKPAATLGLQTRVLSQSVRAPSGLRAASVVPQADGDGASEYIAEWAWNTSSDGAGYRVYLSRGDVAGPYDLMYAQTPGSSALQKYSGVISGVQPGKSIAGTINSLSPGNLQEGPKSNADTATFLSTQSVASPGEGQSVPGGRPTLTWTPLSGAQGYLYRIYDRNPYESDAREVWSNGSTVTTAQSAAYPSSVAALASGTYYWWVAGVRFDTAGNSDAFSFSAPRRFVVP